MALPLLLTCFASGKVVDPTNGFTELKPNASSYHIHKPYKLPVSARYHFQDGTHKLWVYSTDKPEILITGYDYSSGFWQFEAYGFVPRGTSGVCIMQVLGGSPDPTTLMLKVYNGTLSYYRVHVIVPDIYNRWFRLNVIHDVEASKVTVYIDGVVKYEAADHGGTSHYFKCGVYSQDDASHCMESQWKGIRVLKFGD